MKTWDLWVILLVFAGKGEGWGSTVIKLIFFYPLKSSCPLKDKLSIKKRVLLEFNMTVGLVKVLVEGGGTTVM